jgi:hypothetical protein
MSTTSFPTNLDSPTSPAANNKLNSPSHSAIETLQNDAILAIETKVGKDSSAVTTSHDYKLSEVTSTDKAVGKTATQTLTNKTLTSPVFSVGAVGGADISTSAIKLGYASVTANQGTFTTTTDLTSLTSTVTVPSGGRMVKITGVVNMDSSVAGDVTALFIQEGATILNSSTQYTKGGANPLTVTCIAVLTPSAAAHTYKLTATRSTGTGNITMYASATSPAFILVELI